MLISATARGTRIWLTTDRKPFQATCSLGCGRQVPAGQVACGKCQ